MHHDVMVGLTGVQAEYVRSLVNSEAESLAEELGRREAAGGTMSDLTESLEMCDLIVSKFERAIDEGIKKNLNDLRRA